MKQAYVFSPQFSNNAFFIPAKYFSFCIYNIYFITLRLDLNALAVDSVRLIPGPRGATVAHRCLDMRR